MKKYVFTRISCVCFAFAVQLLLQYTYSEDLKCANELYYIVSFMVPYWIAYMYFIGFLNLGVHASQKLKEMAESPKSLVKYGFVGFLLIWICYWDDSMTFVLICILGFASYASLVTLLAEKKIQIRIVSFLSAILFFQAVGSYQQGKVHQSLYCVSGIFLGIIAMFFGGPISTDPVA